MVDTVNIRGRGNLAAKTSTPPAPIPANLWDPGVHSNQAQAADMGSVEVDAVDPSAHDRHMGIQYNGLESPSSFD